MIVRNVAVRQGRTAAAAAAAQPLASFGVRSISTEPPSISGLRHATNAPMPPPPTGVVTPTATDAVPPLVNPLMPASKPPPVPDTTARDFIAMKRWRQATKRIGSVQERQYVPGELLRNPPTPKDVTLELLMASQCHMGHHKSLWNPANARWIYGVRQDIHIISLEQTAAYLRRAARLVEEIAYLGGLILFAGTRKGQMDLVVRAAELAGACHLFDRWTPGTITNRDAIITHRPLKVLDEHDRELPGFKRHLDERRPVTPDLVVCLNPLENFVLLHECVVAQIPTIGVIDTDADATKVTFPIPANDDSLRSTAVIAGVLGRAGEIGQRRRLADAKAGIVTWENQAEVTRYLHEENMEKMKESKQALADEAQAEADLMAAEEIKRLLT